MSEELLVIENLDKLVDMLEKKLPYEFERAARTGMTKSVIDVEGWARENSPLDTGRLRASIGHQVKGTFGHIEGIVGTNVEYAPHVEEPGNVRGVGRRPFLRPAVEEHIRELVHNFEESFRAVAKRLGF